MKSKMQIFFIYDTSCCKNEDDDPKNGILYFMPNQIQESKKCLICLQLVGMLEFFKNNFSLPRLVSLEKGTFAIKYVGSYIMALETAKHVTEDMTQQLIENLWGTLKFYHQDIDHLLEVSNGHQILKTFCRRFFTLFGDLLDLSFDALPKPKFSEMSSPSLHLAMNKYFETCFKCTGCVGGALFYENTLFMASQLPSDLYKKLEFFARCPDAYVVEMQSVNYTLLPNVHLLKIYQEIITESNPTQLSDGSSDEDQFRFDNLWENYVLYVYNYNHLIVFLLLPFKDNSKDEKIQYLSTLSELYLKNFDLELENWKTFCSEEQEVDGVLFDNNVKIFKYSNCPNIVKSSSAMRAVQSIHEELKLNQDLKDMSLEFNQKLVISTKIANTERYSLSSTAATQPTETNI